MMEEAVHLKSFAGTCFFTEACFGGLVSAVKFMLAE